MKQPNFIAPSILSADFAKLGEEVDNVLASGADIVHFDVMDNHYVPNLTIGPLVCDALRSHGVTAPIDVHLMVKPVDRIIPDFAKAGASYITFHPAGLQSVEGIQDEHTVGSAGDINQRFYWVKVREAGRVRRGRYFLMTSELTEDLESGNLPKVCFVKPCV